MPRARVSIVWTATWNDDVKRWTAGFLRQNQWRCDPIHSIDDLMQDAYLLFCKVRDRYPRVINQAAFMKLYKASLRNALHDHARVMMQKRECFAEEWLDEVYTEQLVGDVTNIGELTALLEGADPDIVAALRVFGSNPHALLVETNRRENLNQKLRRILGLGPEFEFTSRLRQLLAD